MYNSLFLFEGDKKNALNLKLIMEQTDYISIIITGKTTDGNLNPKDIDIAETKEILTDVETLLFPSKAEKDELALQKLIKKASSNWSTIKNKDEWLADIRGV